MAMDTTMARSEDGSRLTKCIVPSGVAFIKKLVVGMTNTIVTSGSADVIIIDDAG